MQTFHQTGATAISLFDVQKNDLTEARLRA